MDDAEKQRQDIIHVEQVNRRKRKPNRRTRKPIRGSHVLIIYVDSINDDVQKWQGYTEMEYSDDSFEIEIEIPSLVK